MIGSLMPRSCKFPHYSAKRQTPEDIHISHPRQGPKHTHRSCCRMHRVEVWHTRDCSLIGRRAPTDEGVQCIALTEMDKS